MNTTSRYYGIYSYKNSRSKPKTFNKPMPSQDSTISKWRGLKSKLTLTNLRNSQNRLVLPQQIWTQRPTPPKELEGSIPETKKRPIAANYMDEPPTKEARIARITTNTNFPTETFES